MRKRKGKSEREKKVRRKIEQKEEKQKNRKKEKKIKQEKESDREREPNMRNPNHGSTNVQISEKGFNRTRKMYHYNPKAQKMSSSS